MNAIFTWESDFWQCCPTELSVVREMFHLCSISFVLPNMVAKHVATKHLKLASTAEELNYYFYLL